MSGIRIKKREIGRPEVIYKKKGNVGKLVQDIICDFQPTNAHRNIKESENLRRIQTCVTFLSQLFPNVICMLNVGMCV